MNKTNEMIKDTLLKYAVEALKDVNAKDIRVFETKNNNPFYSYAVLATSLANRQMDGLASKIYDMSKEKDFCIRGIEGRGGGNWLLVDLYDVVINLFSVEERTRYDLDKLYALLPEINISDICK